MITKTHQGQKSVAKSTMPSSPRSDRSLAAVQDNMLSLGTTYGLTGFILLITVMLLSACASTPKAVRTGFLSDYTRLQEVSDRHVRYISPALGNYTRFIIDPIVVYFHDEAKRDTTDAETLTRLTTYMRGALANAIKDRYPIVSQPGSGVARVRVALTDLDKTAPVAKVIPIAKAVGGGRGGASMEGEIIDSQSGEQIAAVIQSSPGKVLSLSGVSKWGDAEVAMDQWASQFRQRLDEAHVR